MRAREPVRPAGVGLRSVLGGLGPVEVRGDDDPVVLDVTADSREVRPGWLFAAIRGARHDGHDHAAEAVRAGACALLVERWLDVPVPQVRVPLVRHAVGRLAAAVHGCPGGRLRIAGITGTNGKTTTAYLTDRACEAAGWRTGLVGTIETRVAGRRSASVFTTPEAPDLQRALAEMVRARVQTVAMEVSSHGLDQHRLDGVPFEVGVFTNLSPEHLDYHGTMEQYWATKARLFEPDRTRRGIVCADDEWGRRLADQARIPVTTYGTAPGNDVVVEIDPHGLDGSDVLLRRGTAGIELRTPLPGRFNALNVAAGYLTARALGVSADRAAAAVAGCETVPGRFECLDAGQPFLVVVDYAHTPDALAGMMATVRALATGRLWVVVGSRGGRDRFKRPQTGRVAAGADVAVVTADSPGHEDPARIAAEMLVGTLGLPTAHIVVELDRRRAIELAVGSAAPGDAVLIVGRGCEQAQNLGGVRVALDDRDVVSGALAARGYRRRLAHRAAAGRAG